MVNILYSSNENYSTVEDREIMHADADENNQDLPPRENSKIGADNERG